MGRHRMNLFVALFVIFILRNNVLGVSNVDNPNDSSDVSDDQSSGAKFFYTPEPRADIRQYYDVPSVGNIYRPYPSIDKKCPLCDSSIYPYCSEKLLHDACCCTNPYIEELPYQCKLADCRFLHANSCREHRLIANCCCSDDYRSLLKTFATKTSSLSSS
ncbi:uncharacterized protein LOC124957054 isoform X2 [Vespa velutina]|uniref:uncharacterized protein LOC124957054 isoform X2 n=1 Tax=Vespa velutina TaxID=202808 RepID=UPI001FB54392|nr:uncharacterized protein LOC124957054 isoform X2 [Vespa velutina]